LGLVLQYKNGENVSDSVGLLISMLVRYPEIGTINYDPETNNINITFIMLKLIQEQVLEKFRANLLSCLETFHYLEEEEPELLEVNYSFCEDITLLEYKRDVSSLTSEEISLTILAVKESFAEYLMNESDNDNNAEIEDEFLQDEELIGQMLENVRYTVPGKKLIAFREEGRVLIFNK
jgi:phosphatidylglycerophosphatase A